MMQVLDTRVEILHVDEDLVVVNKPPSIPVHPIGRFRVSSVYSNVAYHTYLPCHRTIYIDLPHPHLSCITSCVPCMLKRE